MEFIREESSSPFHDNKNKESKDEGDNTGTKTTTLLAAHKYTHGIPASPTMEARVSTTTTTADDDGTKNNHDTFGNNNNNNNVATLQASPPGRATVSPDPHEPAGRKKPPPAAAGTSSVASLQSAADVASSSSSQEDADFLLAQSLHQQELQQAAVAAAANKDDSNHHYRPWPVMESFYRPLLALIWPEIYYPDTALGPVNQKDEKHNKQSTSTASAASLKQQQQQGINHVGSPPQPDFEALLRASARLKQSEDDDDDFANDALALENLRPLWFTGGILGFLEHLQHYECLSHESWEEWNYFADASDVLEWDCWDQERRYMTFKFICKYLDLYEEDALRELLDTAGAMGLDYQETFEQILQAVMQAVKEERDHGDNDDDDDDDEDAKMPAKPSAGDDIQNHDEADPELAAAIAMSLADAAAGAAHESGDGKPPPVERKETKTLVGEKRKASASLGDDDY